MAVQVITRVAANEIAHKALAAAAFTDAILQATQVGSGDNQFANTGTEQVLLDNTGASNRIVTFSGTHANGSTTSLSVTVTAGETALIGPFPVREFGTTVTVVSAHAEIVALVFTKPERGGDTVTA